MSALPARPVRAAATHGSPPTRPRGSAAPGHLLPARGGTLTPETALAIVQCPGDVSDTFLARACRRVSLHYGGTSREGRFAQVLLDSIPQAHGGEKR